MKKTITKCLLIATLMCIGSNVFAINIENLALRSTCTVSTSNVASWESLAAVNDGLLCKNSTDRTYAIYGNWRGEDSYGQYDWVEYDWPYNNQITSVNVYWFTDNGGLGNPTDAYIMYWDGIQWVKSSSVGLELNKFNSVNLALYSNKIRLYMKSTTQTGLVEWEVKGVYTSSCDPATLTSYSKVNSGTLEKKSQLSLHLSDAVLLAPEATLPNGDQETAKWSWSGPNGFTANTQNVTLENLTANSGGAYTVTYIRPCGSTTSATYILNVSDSSTKGANYAWSAYSPALNYNFRDEFPQLEAPTKILDDASNVAGTVTSGWWALRYGKNRRSEVTNTAIDNLLKSMNTNFKYFRDTMGWPPDKRAKNGYYSTIYLYGSGMSTDNADSTALGGWQGSVNYNGEEWPMVLLSYYPIACFDPKFKYTDADYQTGACVHEGIHSVLADLPGCKNSAWFQEGGNTWLQLQATAQQTGDYSSVGYLNGGPCLAPFMPIECYSGWLQDDTFGGPSAEGVNMTNSSGAQVCTWRTYLGGMQYANNWPVFLGETMGIGSVPWIWRNCEGRVLEGMGKALGDNQMRRLITEYRAKQAVVDMGKWSSAFRKIMNDYFQTKITSEWTPSWLTPTVWYATPYVEVTNDGTGLLTPEYRTTPGWSGANQIPLHVVGDTVSVDFQPIGEHMTCQLCYRTAAGTTYYSEPVYCGECTMALHEKPANGVVFAIITNTDYIYEGEKTRKAHFDYRLKMGKGCVSPAATKYAWYNYDKTYTDATYTSIQDVKAAKTFDASITQNVVNRGEEVNVTITGSTTPIIPVLICNVNGQMLYQQNLTGSGKIQLPGGIAAGLYLVTAISGENKKTMKLVVK